jgi:hypothetical protein
MNKELGREADDSNMPLTYTQCAYIFPPLGGTNNLDSNVTYVNVPLMCPFSIASVADCSCH